MRHIKDLCSGGEDDTLANPGVTSPSRAKTFHFGGRDLIKHASKKNF